MSPIWLIYVLLSSALIGAAGLCVERALRRLGRSTRWVWMGVFALAYLLPAVLYVNPPLGGSTLAPPGSPFWGEGPLLPPVRPVEAAEHWLYDLMRVPWGSELGVAILAAWGVLAVGAVAFWGRRVWRLRRRRREWRTAEVAGSEALVSRETGPAVFGVLSPTLVVPEWVLELDEERQRLILAHERAHRDSGDGRLVGATLFLVLLCPWNPVLWWAHRRLRLAVEIDCDRRVLSTESPSVGAYADLLLATVQGRLAGAGPAFGDRPSRLRRRFDAMLPGGDGGGVWLSVAGPVAAGLLLAGALLAVPHTRSAPEPFDPDQPQRVREQIRPYHWMPELIGSERGFDVLGPEELLEDRSPGPRWAVPLRVNRKGYVQDVLLSEFPPGAMREAIGDRIRSLWFRPATHFGEPVTVWVAFRVEVPESWGPFAEAWAEAPRSARDGG